MIPKRMKDGSLTREGVSPGETIHHESRKREEDKGEGVWAKGMRSQFVLVTFCVDVL